jgi:hypothetical protein
MLAIAPLLVYNTQAYASIHFNICAGETQQHFYSGVIKWQTFQITCLPAERDI